MSKEPLISVLFPLYNTEKYVEESVRSILSQTLSDFELIIINDGSKDRSLEIVEKIKDPRIRLFSQENKGLSPALNRAISLSKGKYLARQDADDVSLSTRFEKQFNFMESHPEVGMCGTWATIVDASGKSTGRIHDHPIEDHLLKFALLFNNPFVHSSAFFRKKIIDEIGGYYEPLDLWEDYDLWSRIARVAKVANIPECLLDYREVNSGISQTINNYQPRIVKQNRINFKYYGEGINEKEIDVLLKYIAGKPEEGTDFTEVKETFKKVVKNFSQKENINYELLSKEIERMLFNMKRFYYNSTIYSTEAGALDKVKAKLLRRLLFMTNKEFYKG